MKSEGGFTLLEVLVAVSLAAVLLGALYGTFFISHKAVEGVDDTLIGLHELRTALDTMERELGSALFSKTKKHSSFEVKDRDIYEIHASSLLFTAFHPKRPGVSLISYGVEEQDGKAVLVKEVSSPFKAGAPPAKAEILEDVRDFTVSLKNGSQWSGTWEGEANGGLPEEIKISITVGLGEESFTLMRTARPKIGKTL